MSPVMVGSSLTFQVECVEDRIGQDRIIYTRGKPQRSQHVALGYEGEFECKLRKRQVGGAALGQAGQAHWALLSL